MLDTTDEQLKDQVTKLTTEYWNVGLISACINGCIDTAKVMVDKGANNWDQSLSVLYKSDNLELFNFIVHSAAAAGSDLSCHMLIYCGDDSFSSFEKIKILLEYGADSGTVNYSICCGVASDNNRQDIAEFITSIVTKRLAHETYKVHKIIGSCKGEFESRTQLSYAS